MYLVMRIVVKQEAVRFQQLQVCVGAIAEEDLITGFVVTPDHNAVLLLVGIVNALASNACASQC
jgi:hypothetical protein